MPRITLHLALALALLTGGLGLTGCGNRPAPGTPAAPAAQTYEYRVTQGILVLSQANTAAAKMAVSLNARGTLTDDQTRNVLDYTDRIAMAAKSVAQIKDGATSATQKAAAIKSLLAVLQVPPNVANSALSDALAAVSMAVLQIMGVN